MMRVLIIDDEAAIRATLAMALEGMGHEAHGTDSGKEALELLERQPFEAAFLDIRLGRERGLEVLTRMLAVAPRLCVVVMTGFVTIDSAVEAIRNGAFDYLPKPFSAAQVGAVLDKAERVRGLRVRVDDLESQIQAAVPEADLRAPDPAMQRVLDLAYRAAPSDATILLRGESGTGKGVVARALHARSRRSDGPFVTVSCPSLGAELLESELFGHVRGAFTGAVRDTTGKVALAQGGTLFLDEIGDLPPPLQPKLLRLLQERQYERVGDTRTCKADVRIVAATHKNLAAAVSAGQFREDLLYRLNVIELVLPPLRERPEAIPRLAEHLLAFFAQQMGKPVAGFTPEAMRALERHAWPGNVRELRNVLERAVILASGERIEPADLPAVAADSISSAGPVSAPADGEPAVGRWSSLEDVESEHIRRVLAAIPNLERAAAVLGIDRATLYRKRKRYGI